MVLVPNCRKQHHGIDRDGSTAELSAPDSVNPGSNPGPPASQSGLSAPVSARFQFPQPAARSTPSSSRAAHANSQVQTAVVGKGEAAVRASMRLHGASGGEQALMRSGV